MTAAPPPPPVAPADFRAAMGRWATGVSVVTARAGEVDAGLTVNALLSVALEPPSLLVSLQREVDSLPVMRQSGTFAVNFLAAAQRALSERFGRPAPFAEKFRGVALHRGLTGAPLLDGCLGALECRLASTTPAYDHELVIGEVLRVEPGPDGPPLLFYRGSYAEAEGEERLRLGRRPPGPAPR